MQRKIGITMWVCPNLLAYHRVEAASLPPDVRLVRQGWRTYKPARHPYDVRPLTSLTDAARGSITLRANRNPFV